MHIFEPMGDKAILIKFEQKISSEISAKIRQLTASIEASQNPAVIETIPSYAAVCVIYEPLIMNYDTIKTFLSSLLANVAGNDLLNGVVFEIPVLYNHETGPDLGFISGHSGLCVEEIIKIHTAPEYLIYMLGFAPGFPYLGGMDERIAAPRLKVPRQKIVPGSVGIAGNQTGMYPIESPGGWQLIGRTPIKLYDPERTPPVYYQAGDYIKYKAIDASEFEHLQELVAGNAYEVKSWPKSK